VGGGCGPWGVKTGSCRPSVRAVGVCIKGAVQEGLTGRAVGRPLHRGDGRCVACVEVSRGGVVTVGRSFDYDACFQQ
jgi:hypothetical protein